MASPFLFERITIIGLGLIGSSIARAVRAKKLADTIVGCDDSEVSLTYARSSKIIDIAMNDLATAVRDSQLVIFAVPPSQMEQVAKLCAPGLKNHAIVMDTASVKIPVMTGITKHLPAHVDFIPAHPIAGSEQSGIRAGRADLFDGRRIILTPNEPLQDRMLQIITHFWSAMGARVEGMPPDMHDTVYAYVSHLPQLLAFATRGLVKNDTESDTLKKFLRLRESNTTLWADIFILNRDHVLVALDRYLDAIWHIKGELKAAPKEEQSAANDVLARNVLFPRIAAACLITTVMEAEKKLGISFARYAGTGFSDFTTPAALAPEQEIEQISGHYLPVLNILQEYVSALKTLRASIENGDPQILEKALQGA